MNDLFMLKQVIKTINSLNEQIKQIDERIAALVDKLDLELVCSVPGVGVRFAVIILAELGDTFRFSNCKMVASWAGLAPSLHQSAGTTIIGHITKRGSKMFRWCMVEVVHAAVRSDNWFKEMFNRISVQKGCKVAYVAVVRKLLMVVWYLFVNGEKYVEEGFSKGVVKVKRDCDGVVVVSFGSLVEIFLNSHKIRH